MGGDMLKGLRKAYASKGIDVKQDKPASGIKYINPGPWPIYIGFTTSKKAFAAEMKRLKITNVSFFGREHASATTHIFTHQSALTCIITILPFNAKNKIPSREAYAALIAHEAMHVIQEMQQRLAGGHGLGDEAEAYLIQQIVQECLQDAWASNQVRRIEPA